MTIENCNENFDENVFKKPNKLTLQELQFIVSAKRI